MRRTAILLVIGLILIGASPVRAQSIYHAENAPCDIRWKAAYYQDGDTHPVRRIIRCAVRLWPVPGGVKKAFSVARCESGFRPDAYYAGNAGVFQQRTKYWKGRVRTYLRRWWPSNVSPFNGRANVILSVRMANRYGWNAWACA